MVCENSLKNRGRLEFLDTLRGLAAVYVVVYHMLLIPQPNLIPPKWVEVFALWGGSGVTLFFMVSAFSLYYTMPFRLKDENPTVSFYLHRIFRIAPLFYFLIIVTIIRDAYLFNTTHSFSEIVLSLTFIFNLIPTHQEGFVWAGWTIGVEMIFYAMFPLIYSRIKTIRGTIALIFFCILFWMFVQLAINIIAMPEIWRSSMLRFSAFKHFPIFASGMLVYHLFMSFNVEKRDAGDYKGYGNVLLMTGVLLYEALTQNWLPSFFGDMYYWQGLVYGCIFLGLGLSPWSWAVNKGTRLLGKISYSVYLNHTTVIFLMTPIYRWLYLNSLTLTLAFLISLLLTFAVVLPISALTYRFIELPGIAAGKWMIARINQKNFSSRRAQ